MYAVVLALALVIVLYLIGRPLFQPDWDEEAQLLQGRVDASEMERERVFAALVEVENDYQMNKLSEADYQELKRQYTRQALEYLKNSASPSPAGMRPARRKPRPDLKQVEAEAEAEVALALGAAAGRPAAVPGSLYCPHCGAEMLSVGQKFCHVCGRPQRREA